MKPTQSLKIVPGPVPGPPLDREPGAGIHTAAPDCGPRGVTCLAAGSGALLFLAACTVKPFVYRNPQGAMTASLGGSLMTKADEEVATIEMPDGTKMSHQIRGKDETVVPNSYIGYKTLTGLADAANAGEAIREDAATARAVSSDGVKVKKIEADVTKATFVPHEVAPVTPP